MNRYISLPYRADDITGQRFGRLVALGPIGRNDRRSIVWRCLCDCGKHTDVTAVSLRSGHTSSCGCLRLERNWAATKTHGMTNTRLYRLWTAMLARCHSSIAKGYADYGARGIEVCPEWRHDFQVFHDFVTQLPNYNTKGYTLDRIDNDGNYEPGNVRWASRWIQSRNNRRNVVITHDGRTKCLSDWAEELGVLRSTLAGRLARGWSVERAFTTPVQLQYRNGR